MRSKTIPWKKLLMLLGIALALEVFLFNWRTFATLGAKPYVPEYVLSERTVLISVLDAEPGTVHIDYSALRADGSESPLYVDIRLADEGSAEGYPLDQATIYSGAPKTTYLNVHSYGKASSMAIVLTPQFESEFELRGITFDARVPFFFSIPRLLLLFAILFLIWALNPANGLVLREYGTTMRKIVTGAIITLNLILFLVMVRWGAAFLHPVWAYHYQYQELARSISQGHLWIDVGNEDLTAALAAMDNPYDYRLRLDTVPGSEQVWDTSYFGGKFYVYFGIVPELLYYLPCYLILHRDFPTWLGVFFSGGLALVGAYLLVLRLCARAFPRIPQIWRLTLAALLSNSVNFMIATLHADLYYLPIMTAMACVFWGFFFLLETRVRLEEGRKAVATACVGGLLLALTAGCRPQFLASSLLLIPLFWKEIRAAFGKDGKKERIALIAALIPYAVVGILLMVYNAARFGSPFDFGATYVLTNNDMNHRSKNLELLLSGVYSYFLQPTGMSYMFPFVQTVTHYFGYLGTLIYDYTVGGLFWSVPLLLGFGLLGAARSELASKRLFGCTVLAAVLSLVVAAADATVAGVQVRYYLDFLYLAVIAAGLVLLALTDRVFAGAEQWNGGSGSGDASGAFTKSPLREKYLRAFLLAAGLYGIFFQFMAAVKNSGMLDDNVRIYYAIKAFFP